MNKGKGKCGDFLISSLIKTKERRRSGPSGNLRPKAQSPKAEGVLEIFLENSSDRYIPKIQFIKMLDMSDGEFYVAITNLRNKGYKIDTMHLKSHLYGYKLTNNKGCK